MTDQQTYYPTPKQKYIVIPCTECDELTVWCSFCLFGFIYIKVGNSQDSTTTFLPKPIFN